MNDKLRTIDDDYQSEVAEAVDPEHARKFVWTSIGYDETREGIVAYFREQELEVLDVLPHWQVLACTPDTPASLRRRMVKSFVTCMKSEDAAFRGAMFGYPSEDVTWYIGEIESALDRAFAYLRETKE
ncbi:MAG: hypothetical protein JRL30_01365 [Deltaproteobacteria bacterium]|nr:hypothetical protein [Deltaproteobacteria bacterium]